MALHRTPLSGRSLWLALGAHMNDKDWRTFLTVARNILGKGEAYTWASECWCAWTTFSSLSHELTYWKKGLPDVSELQESKTSDGGLWGQSFQYSDIAHFIIPAQFYWERVINGNFSSGYKSQDINKLSEALKTCGISHRLTDSVLEIKLY